MSRSQGLGDLIPGCFAVPQNPFYPTQGPNCKGNMPVSIQALGNRFKSGSIPMSVNTGLNVSDPVQGSSAGAITVAPSQDSSYLPAATTQVSPSITQTAVGFGSGRGGYGDGVYKWQPDSVYASSHGYDDGWNGNASHIPLSPASLLNSLPKVVSGSIDESQQTMCDGLTGWVANNPMLAAAALVGLYFAMRGK